MTERTDTTEPPGPQSRAAEIVAGLLAVLLCVSVLGWLQYSIDYIDDGDSYFHLRAAQQIREDGISREFPQTQFSTWKNDYSDKDFLFHVALFPFVGDGSDLLAGGKLAVVVFDALVLLALLLVLLGLRVRFVWLWILLLLGFPMFQHYMLSARPHLLSNVLVLIEVLLIARNMPKRLFAVSAVHVWSHSSFVLVPAMAGARIVASLLARERPPWKLLLAAVLGVATTSLLHPYFPNNLTLAYDQIVQVARNVWGLGADIPEDLFGRELLPPEAKTLLFGFPAWGPALAGVVVLALRRDLLRATAVMTVALVSAGFFVLSVLSARFYPLCLCVLVVLAGCAWTRAADGRSLRELWRAGVRPVLVMVLLVACLLVGYGRRSIFALRDQLATGVNEVVFASAAQYLDRNAAPTDVVYHSFWSDFAGLYFFRPNGRYIVALDPVFLYRYDARRFGRALEAYRGTARDVRAIVGRDFGARWVFVSNYPHNKPFDRLLQKAPGIVLRHQDPYTRVYEVLQ